MSTAARTVQKGTSAESGCEACGRILRWSTAVGPVPDRLAVLIRRVGDTMYQLPDIYETRQAKAMLKALQEGDNEQARKIEDHLVAEASTDPEDGEKLREELRAALLFRAQTDASEAGDQAGAELFRQLMLATCSTRTVKLTIAGALLHAGLQEGGLPAKSHDQLTALLEETKLSEEMRTLVESVPRLP